MLTFVEFRRLMHTFRESRSVVMLQLPSAMAHRCRGMPLLHLVLVKDLLCTAVDSRAALAAFLPALVVPALCQA